MRPASCLERKERGGAWKYRTGRRACAERAPLSQRATTRILSLTSRESFDALERSFLVLGSACRSRDRLRSDFLADCPDEAAESRASATITTWQSAMRSSAWFTPIAVNPRAVLSARIPRVRERFAARSRVTSRSLTLDCAPRTHDSRQPESARLRFSENRTSGCCCFFSREKEHELR